MEPVDARAIANYFLALGKSEGLRIDPMKILKLTYIAHGWVLGLTGRPLIQQPVYAWPYGPVIEDVYHAFKVFRTDPIETPACRLTIDRTWEPYEAQVSEEVEEILQSVWEEYKPFSGLQLSSITHEPNSPWGLVAKGLKSQQIRNLPIPDEMIQRHYSKLAESNATEAV
ncbi:MAG: Panacea domain-containing protein [Fimbriiglobus sp.]